MSMPESNALLTISFAVCMVLAVIVGYSYLRVDESAKLRLQNLLAPKVNFDMPKPEQLADFQMDSIEEFNVTIERPLFVKGRKPIETEDDDNDQSNPFQAPTTMNAKFMGLFSVGKMTKGLFLQSDGKYVKSEVGELVDGWELNSLTQEDAVLHLGAQKSTVLIHKPEPKAAPPSRVKRPARKKNPFLEINRNKKPRRMKEKPEDE